MMAQNVLILYYSQFNNTAKLATAIRQATGADILRIQVTTKTFPEDMTATDDIYKKQRATNQLPTLTTKLPPLAGYDVILIGGPVWDGQFSSPIMALLTKIQGYQGKVAPFSSGWSDTGNYQQDFVAHAGKLQVTPGYHVLTHANPKLSINTLSSWLRKL